MRIERAICSYLKTSKDIIFNRKQKVNNTNVTNDIVLECKNYDMVTYNDRGILIVHEDLCSDVDKLA